LYHLVRALKIARGQAHRGEAKGLEGCQNALRCTSGGCLLGTQSNTTAISWEDSASNTYMAAQEVREEAHVERLNASCAVA
jgi:hypothetical protein